MRELPEHPLLESIGVSDTELGRLTLASLDHLQEAISIFDQGLRLMVWNRRFLELLDFPPELIRIGLPFDELMRFNARRGEYGEGDPEALVAERVRLARRFESHCFERIRPDGTVLEVRGQPISGGGFITIYQDITARKRAEASLLEHHLQLEARVAERTAELLALNEQFAREIEERKAIDAALRESESRIRLITDTVPVLIGYLDADRRYQFVNQKYAEWFGVPAETFLGRTFGEVLEPALARRLQARVGEALNGRSTHLEYELATPGGRMYVRAYFIPHVPQRVQAEAGAVGCFVLTEDLTEYRQAQMALNQAQKLKAVGQLTGGIAHDFNNLLTVILGNLASVEESLRDQPEHYKAVGTAMNAARRGADLTRRLLAFSRRQTLQPCLLSPRQQLPEIAELLKRTLGASIELETATDEAVWTIQVDPGQLANAVLNLAINARDAMPDGGRLRIEARNVTLDRAYAGRYPDVVPGDYVRLTVADTGTGMTPEVLEQAFEPFFTTKGLGAGTGLGLSMVYGFVQQSGGHVRIRSQLGGGTSVELYLPRHVAKGKERMSGSTVSANFDESRLRGREAILLVEDDPDIRDFVARTLLGLGYTVREAVDGKSALESLETDAPVELLLSDMTMPGGISGRDLVIEARRRCPALKILCMSGYSDQVVASLVPLDYSLLEKPFLKHDLARAVRSTLDRPAGSAASAPG
ncbi:MAG: PAS-domain containing protein [Candidatus Competibacter sp.]|jgi:PAS domain S-box-containing protein